jgi:hypothetical protein
MKKAGALASALRNGGARAALKAIESGNPPSLSDTTETRQPSRVGTKPITVHYPEVVRRQLKALAGQEGRDVADWSEPQK